MRQTAAASIAESFNENYPLASSAAVARMMYKEYPEAWPSVNAARSCIRRIRGSAGVKNRKKMPHARLPKEIVSAHISGVPPSEKTGFEWIALGEGPERWMIISDLHIPYHDYDATMLALDFGAKNTDAILVNGDFADAYQLSSFQRDPTRRDFKAELDAVSQFLDALTRSWKTVVVKLGNHEQRLERYMLRKAPELFGIDLFTWQSMLCLKEKGIACVSYMNPIVHRELTILHGHEWGKSFSSPVNQARGTSLKSLECVLEGHGHRTSHHTETALRGRNVSCWSTGCLCDLRAEYRPLNKWNHGFAILNTSSGKSSWSIENYRIIDGEIIR